MTWQPSFMTNLPSKSEAANSPWNLKSTGNVGSSGSVQTSFFGAFLSVFLASPAWPTRVMAKQTRLPRMIGNKMRFANMRVSQGCEVAVEQYHKRERHRNKQIILPL